MNLKDRLPSANDAVEFFLNAGLQMRFSQGKDGGPLQSCLDRLGASAEHVADDLLHLAVGVLAGEELLVAALFFGVLDLEDVRVDDVADVVGIEAGLVVVDDLLIEAVGLLQVLYFLVVQRMSRRLHKSPMGLRSGALYLTDFVEGETETRQEFQDGDETGHGGDGEETESFLDQVGEAEETWVVGTETDRHQQRADDVRDGQGNVRAQLNRCGSLSGQILQQSLDFAL